MRDGTPGARDEVVELHPAGDGRWAWTYRRGDVALRSNKDYDDEAAARAGAGHAYPDVRVVAPPPEPAQPHGRPPRRRPSRRELARATLAAAALGALLHRRARRRST